MLYYLSLLLVSGLALASPSVQVNTEAWQRLEHELGQYLAVEQETHLARWQQITSQTLDPTSEEKLKVLSAGKQMILQRLAEVNNGGPAWQNTVAARLEAYCKNHKIPTDLSLSETETSSLLKFLWELHPDPRALTVLEWKMLGIVVGENIRNTFLLTAFSPEPWNNTRAPAADAKSSFQGNTTELVYIENEYQWNSAGNEIQRMMANLPEPQVLKKGVARLEKLGIKVHTMALSPFPNIDDQAHELEHSFEVLKRKTSAPIIILSSGLASAVVYRWLDLHPENRDRSDIRAWINWNGRLYGVAPGVHSAAALEKAEKMLRHSRSPAAETDWELAASVLKPQGETANPAVPLGPGFAVINFVPLAGKDHPAENPREAIVPEGKVFADHEPWTIGDLPLLIQRALNL